MDFERQRGFLLDGQDPPEKVGCRKESNFWSLCMLIASGILLEEFSMSFLIVPRAPITTGTIVVLISPHIQPRRFPSVCICKAFPWLLLFLLLLLLLLSLLLSLLPYDH